MRILVIGTVRQAHDAIVKMGHDIVLFIKRGSTKSGDLTFGYEKLFIFNDNAEASEYIETAKALHATSPFDAVCAFNDDTQAVAIETAETLGLYRPVGKDVLDIAFNKEKTREVLRTAGLDDTECRVAGDEAELRDIVGCGAGKRIIKPTSATASLGISVIENHGDLDRAVAWLKQCKAEYPVIVEDFLEGDEYSVESLSEDGEHFVLAVTRKTKDAVNFVELGHTLPAPLDEPSRTAIERFISDSLSALGIHNGPAHTEIILTAKGPRIVETHTRGGGDRIFQLVELATGINLLEMIARQNLGEKILPRIRDLYRNDTVAAIRFLAVGYDAHTRLKSINCLDSWKETDGVVEVTPMKGAGATMDKVTNSFDRTALAIATAPSAELAEQAAAAGLASVVLELERSELSQ